MKEITPEYILEILKQIQFYDQFLLHRNLSKKETKHIRKSINKAIGHLEKGNFKECKILSKEMREDYDE